MNQETSKKLFAEAQKYLPGGVDSPARAYTKRDKIIKFAGGYHGHADGLLVKAGSGIATLGLPDSPGVPESYAQNTLVAPYNCTEAVENIFDSLPEEIAAVIV